MRRGDARDLEGRNNRGSDPFAPAWFRRREGEEEERGCGNLGRIYVAVESMKK